MLYRYDPNKPPLRLRFYVDPRGDGEGLQLNLFEGAELGDSASEHVAAGIGGNQLDFEHRIANLSKAEITLVGVDQVERGRMVNIEAERRALHKKVAEMFASHVMTSAEEASEPCQAAPSLKPPPLNAQFLLDLFLPESRCEEFLGDLEERYNRKLPRLGKTRADWWYRKQVATSLLPLLRAWLGQASKGTLAKVFCFGLRLIGLGSWADALRKALDEERKRSV